jgi:putative ABC transport system permease protein
MTRVWLWLRSIFFPSRLDRDIQDEVSAHLRHAAERLEATGLSPDEARLAAQRAFGNVSAIKEETRDAWAGRGLDSVLADLRYGVRGLARTPFSAATMILIFALGIGCNGFLFLLISSFVNAPVPGLSRDASVVRIRGIERRAGPTIGREFSYPEYRDYVSQTKLFASVAAWTSSDVVLGVTSGDNGAETLSSGAATYVTANYFQVLGIQPIRGAGLPTDTPDDLGTPPLVAVISHAVWERSFGRAPDVVGRTMKVSNTAVTIVGVAPKRFSGARTGGSQMRVWLPLSARAVVQRTPTDFTSYDPAYLGLVARLQPGVEPAHALPTVEAIGARSMQLMTMTSGAIRSTDVATLLAGNYFPPSGDDGEGIGRFASLLLPTLILLVTCTNVSALLTGLAIARRREIAVRLALGAARRRVVRQLLTESVLLAVAAAAFALLVIWIALQYVESTVGEIHVVFDWRPILFTLAIALVAGTVFGLSPALHGTRVSLSDVLKDGAGAAVVARSRLQSGLVVAQIAFTQPFLLAMGTLILEMREDLHKVPSAPYADRVIDVRFNTNPRYGALDQAREAKLQRLQERLAALPGVVGVVPQESLADAFDAVVHQADRIGDQADHTLEVTAQAAPIGYFDLMGVPIVRGRGFAQAQREERGSIIIGAATARRLWPDADPLGRRLAATTPTQRGGLFTVVGVFDETTAGVRDDGNRIRVFVADVVGPTGHFLVRTQAPAQSMLPTIRAVGVAEAPDLPFVSSRTLAAIEAEQRSSLTRVIAGASGIGAIALFLSAIGLYAVVAFAVQQRVREIGIRTALGADRQQVVGSFVRRGLNLGLIGMAVGLTLSILVVRLVSVMQGEDTSFAIVGLAALVAGVALVVTLVATWVPARRAAAVDPLLALRAE